MSKISAKLGVLSRPDGSALLTQGETTVMAGVYGPVEAKIQKLLTNKASVECCYRPKSGIPGIGDKLYESIIQNICEAALASALYPRSSIVLIIQEMQNHGGLISCAANAACLALLSSGIDMRFMVGSVCCVIDNEDELHVNPNKIQWQKSKATFVFVFESVSQGIVASYTSGSFSLINYQHALSLCKTASKEIFDFYKSVMRDNLVNEL